MNHNEIPEKPLVPGINSRGYNPERTYFFEREDGTTFFTNANEAWTIYKRRQQIVGKETPRIKYLGNSDGSKFKQAVMEAKQMFREKGLEISQERLRQGEREELEEAKKDKTPPPQADKFGDGAFLI